MLNTEVLNFQILMFEVLIQHLLNSSVLMSAEPSLIITAYNTGELRAHQILR